MSVRKLRYNIWTLGSTVADTEVGRRTPHPSRSESKSEVSRTANIEKTVMGTATFSG